MAPPPLEGRVAVDKVYHVFVSSTYSDLKDERKKVSEAIAKAGYVPEGMELFPASSQKQFEFIKRVIDRCDYYVLIIGGRYGSVADNNVSYTEMEYDYASEKGVSILAFPHANPDKIESGKTEKAPENIERLRLFRERVTSGSLVDFWQNADELSAKVVVALGQEVTLNPGVGWVRGDQAVDPKIYRDLESLRKERDDLKERLGRDILQFPEWLPSPSSGLRIDLNAKITKTDRSIDPVSTKTRVLFERSASIDTTWNDVIRLCGYHFYKPVHEYSFMKTINEALCRAHINEIADYDEQAADGFMTVISREFDSNLEYTEARDFLIAADLISHSLTRGTHGDYASYELTIKGKKYVAYLNAKGLREPQ